jgi:4a-hydroxytetrahydrobiopterin dehydratase
LFLSVSICPDYRQPAGTLWQGGGVEKLSTQEILGAGLGDWRKLAQGLHARYRIADLKAGAAFVAAVAEAAEAASHYPGLKLTSGVVDVSLCTREDGLWVTRKDIDMARQVSQIARHHGLEPEPSAVAQLEIALDTASEDRVAPFWSVLLTGSPGNKVYDSVFDPTSRVPGLWFQGTGEHETPRQRWHFDLWLAPEAAQERITAAVAHGGRVIDDSQAPAFIVLADPDGNKVCVCTCLGRD